MVQAMHVKLVISIDHFICQNKILAIAHSLTLSSYNFILTVLYLTVLEDAALASMTLRHVLARGSLAWKSGRFIFL